MVAVKSFPERRSKWGYYTPAANLGLEEGSYGYDILHLEAAIWDSPSN